MTKKETYEDGRRSMAAEIMLILAAGAGTSDLAHIVQSVVRNVWDPENYPWAPLPGDIAARITKYDDALHASEIDPPKKKKAKRRGFGSRGIIVSPESNAAVEGADTVDENLGDA